MDNNLKYVLAFISGAAIGSVVTWKLLKSKYEQITREEIESYKEALAIQKHDNCSNEEQNPDGVCEPSAPIPSPEDVETADLYAAKLKTLGYTAEKPDVEIATPEEECDENEEEEDEYEPMSKPHVIDPINYGEKDDYGCESLAYYSDGVLADNMDQPIDNIEDLVGDALEHFGDYEEDAVHVRNDRLKCDYEILYDHRTFSEYTAKKVPYKSEE